MKNKIEHTPGPWAKAGTKTNPYSYGVYGGENNGTCFKVAHCMGLNSEANARLIAAAPDMYKFIQDVVDVIENATSKADRRTIADAARAAIAKAKGEA